MSRSVDGHNLLKSEIPFQLGFDERSHKSTTSGIDMNDSINILLDEEVINGLSIFVFAGICTSEDDANSNLGSQLCTQLLKYFIDGIFRLSGIEPRLTVFSSTISTACSGSMTYLSGVQYT